MCDLYGSTPGQAQCQWMYVCDWKRPRSGVPTGVVRTGASLSPPGCRCVCHNAPPLIPSVCVAVTGARRVSHAGL